jgi:hypothetical protein
MRKIIFGTLLGALIGLILTNILVNVIDYEFDMTFVITLGVGFPALIGGFLSKQIKEENIPRWLVILFDSVTAFIETGVFTFFVGFVFLALFFSPIFQSDFFGRYSSGATYITILGLLFLVSSVFIYFVWKSGKRSWLVLAASGFGFLFGLAVFSTALSDHNPGSGYRARDARRIADMKQLQLALDLYSDEHNRLYPPVTDGCSDINILSSYLVPKYMSVLPIEPEKESKHPQYQIEISPNREDYVLKAVLGESSNSALSRDLDGQVLGCQCDDPNYCVQP